MFAAPVKRNPALGENGRDLLFKHGPSCYCARSQMSPTNKTTLWEGKPELGDNRLIAVLAVQERLLKIEVRRLNP
jgi:hypothetical protein